MLLILDFTFQAPKEVKFLFIRMFLTCFFFGTSLEIGEQKMISSQSYQLTRNFGPKPEFGPNSQNDPKKARILAFWPDF